MKKILHILLISYKNYTAYLSDIVGINIILALRIVVISVLYAYLYKNFANNGVISWFTIEQITYALITAQVVSTAKPKIADEIQLDVKSWRVSIYLLNPFSYIYFKFLEFFPIFLHNIIIWLGIWLLIWFLILWTFPLTIWWIFWWIILLIWSMLTVFFWYMIIWLLSFYTEDSEAFRFIYSKADMILWGNIIPIPFLPEILQTIAYLSPFAYFWYTTGLVFSNFEMLTFLKYLLIQVVWIIINLWICIVLYNHAKNKLTINWW